jgi:ATPase subunit of ABC transporter with duplicated ATPase domains
VLKQVKQTLQQNLSGTLSSVQTKACLIRKQHILLIFQNDLILDQGLMKMLPRCACCAQVTYPPNPVTGEGKTQDEWRGFLGRFGISGKMQTTPIKQLSDGQKSRIIFATLCLRRPNLLLLDEVRRICKHD